MVHGAVRPELARNQYIHIHGDILIYIRAKQERDRRGPVRPGRNLSNRGSRGVRAGSVRGRGRPVPCTPLDETGGRRYSESPRGLGGLRRKGARKGHWAGRVRICEGGRRRRLRDNVAYPRGRLGIANRADDSGKGRPVEKDPEPLSVRYDPHNTDRIYRGIAHCRPRFKPDPPAHQYAQFHRLEGQARHAGAGSQGGQAQRRAHFTLQHYARQD